ncbi:hypothetical protein KKB83_00385 [Patescibacteria group bacterium]|nr:hypothetical protein [Patescibacteria group bacterium]
MLPKLPILNFIPVALFFALSFFTLSVPPAAAFGTSASGESDFWSRWGIELSVLPQSPFFSIRHYWENIRLFLTANNTEERAVLLLSFGNRRLEEICAQISPIGEEANNREALITPELLATLKRYHNQMTQLSQLLPSLEAGGSELGQLWKMHDDKKAEFQNIVETYGAKLGFVWRKEILETLNETTTVSSEQILGSRDHTGLELYRLK